MSMKSTIYNPSRRIPSCRWKHSACQIQPPSRLGKFLEIRTMPRLASRILETKCQPLGFLSGTRQSGPWLFAGPCEGTRLVIPCWHLRHGVLTGGLLRRVVDRIKSAVNAALADQGWTQVHSYGSIVALEITQNQQSLNTFNDNFGGGSCWGVFAESTTTSSTFKLGTVVVRLFDTKSKKLLWRASASSTLFSKSEKNIQTLDRGVPKMF